MLSKCCTQYVSKFEKLIVFSNSLKDREAWHAAVHGAEKSRTWLSNWTTTNTLQTRIVGPKGIHICSFSVWVHAKPLHLCLILCDPMDCRLPGSSVCGILQARILEWIAMLSSRGSSWPSNWTHVSMSPAMAGRFFTTSTTWEAWETPCCCY